MNLICLIHLVIGQILIGSPTIQRSYTFNPEHNGYWYFHGKDTAGNIRSNNWYFSSSRVTYDWPWGYTDTLAFQDNNGYYYPSELGRDECTLSYNGLSLRYVAGSTAGQGCRFYNIYAGGGVTQNYPYIPFELNCESFYYANPGETYIISGFGDYYDSYYGYGNVIGNCSDAASRTFSWTVSSNAINYGSQWTYTFTYPAHSHQRLLKLMDGCTKKYYY